MKKIKLNPVLLYAVIFFLSSYTTAQNKYDESLLWEITGNGLKSPSYLFGTIHVQDKRVFDLPDSVIIAIENCDAFAGELNMDSIYSQLIVYFLKNRYEGKSVEELLSEEEYKQLNEKAIDKLDKSLDELNTEDPRIIAFAFESESLQKDMPYTLDEYLYRIAKTNNKLITSVEQLEDQLYLFDSFSDETIKELLLKIIEEEETDIEEIIVAYSSNKLDQINDLMIEFEDEFSELANIMVYKRNIGMAESITLIAQKYPVFVAIGAAHLSGDKGVLALLRNYGFQIRPVFSNKSGLVNHYSIEKIELPWQKFSTPSGGFEIEMPGIPYPVPINDEHTGLKIESHMYLDEPKQMIYLVVKYESVLNFEEKADSLINSILENMTGRKDSIVANPVTTADGFPGKEIEAEVNLTPVKINLFTRKNQMYMIFVSVTEDSAGKKNVERFLKSFKLTQVPEPKDKSWNFFIDDTCAFKVRLPGEPLKQVLKNKTIAFTASDESGKNSYTVFCFNSAPQLESDAKESVVEQIITNYQTTNNLDLINRRDVINDRYSYTEFSFKYKNELNYARFYSRGSKIYMLLSSGISNLDTIQINNFFSSFEYLDFKPVDWKNYSDSLKEFSVDFPSPVVDHADVQIGTHERYNSVDEFSGTSYNVEKIVISEYYQADSTFFYERVKILKDSTATILSDTLYTVNNTAIKELVIKGNDIFNLARIRLILNGKRCYIVYVLVPEINLYDEKTNHFFDSFKVIKNDSHDIYSDKTQIFFNDIISSDKSKRNAALTYSGEFSYNESHLNKIYELLQSEYDDDDTIGVRCALFNALNQIESDSKIDFAKKIYPELPENPAMLLAALEVVGYINSQKSTEAFRELILSRPPRYDDLPYSLFYPFYDSTRNIKYLFPNLLELTSYKEYNSPVYSLLSYYYRESSENEIDISGYEDDLISQFIETKRKYEEDEDSEETWRYYFTLQNMLTFIHQLGNDEVIIEALKEILEFTDDELSCSAAICLIKSDQPVTEEKINSLAVNIKTRNVLYENLIKIQKQNLFPAGLLSQEFLAEGDLNKWLSEDYELPDSLILIDKKKTEAGNFFLYKFHIEEDEEDTWYIGISGPQPVDENSFIARAENTRSNYNLIDDKSIEEHWGELLNEEEVE